MFWHFELFFGFSLLVSGTFCNCCLPPFIHLLFGRRMRTNWKIGAYMLATCICFCLTLKCLRLSLSLTQQRGGRTLSQHALSTLTVRPSSSNSKRHLYLFMVCYRNRHCRLKQSALLSFSLFAFIRVYLCPNICMYSCMHVCMYAWIYFYGS